MLTALIAAAAVAVPDTATALSLFADAVSRARSVRVAPFLRYEYHLTLVHGTTSKRYGYRVLERLDDHVGRFVSIDRDGSDSRDISVHLALVSPALFLGAVHDDVDAGADPQGTAPPTIGVVISSPYDVTFDGSESMPDGTTALKLKLAPRSKPDVHQLRELWIDPVSHAIRRAELLKTVAIISREPTLFDLDLDDAGFVDHWSFSGTGHIAFVSYALQADGTFAGITQVPSADAALFR